MLHEESIREKKYPILSENRVDSPSFMRKHPDIWDKFLKIQRKRFVEQLSRKFKRMSVSTRI